jgi:hypothetical protein
MAAAVVFGGVVIVLLVLVEVRIQIRYHIYHTRYITFEVQIATFTHLIFSAQTNRL